MHSLQYFCVELNVQIIVQVCSQDDWILPKFFLCVCVCRLSGSLGP